MADWYYIGHYGQLGPLTREQVDELVEGGVIMPDTYVWRSGMPSWQVADTVAELRTSFAAAAPYAAPPPPPMHTPPPMTAPPREQFSPPQYSYQGASHVPSYSQISPYRMDVGLAMRSDRNATLAGILQIVLPGVGRMYLGYYAYGTLQLILTLCTGVMWLWPLIDGIIILSGGLKYDGFGRVLRN